MLYSLLSYQEELAFKIMAETKQANIKELIPDSKNFNRHSEYGMSLLEKSVGKFGMGRSILLDRNNRIIAGNGITETAGQLGIEDVEIVETDGTKIVAVKRTDIDLDTPQGREMALADNATNKANLKWDKEATDAAHYFNRISGRYEALSERMKNGGMSPKFIACRITRETSLWKRYPEKMRASRKKHGQTLHMTWEEERRRVRAGLPQKTRLKVPKAADGKERQAINNKRWYLRKRGYRIDGNMAYWNGSTERALRLEKFDTTFKYRMEEES